MDWVLAHGPNMALLLACSVLFAKYFFHILFYVGTLDRPAFPLRSVDGPWLESIDPFGHCQHCHYRTFYYFINRGIMESLSNKRK
jgi:hypothetical protein